MSEKEKAAQEAPEKEDFDALMARMERAAQEAAQEEAKGLVLDFDEALREHRKRETRLEVRFQGVMYSLPSTTPANFALFYIRHCLKPGKGGGWEFTVPEDKFPEFIELMFGEKFSKAVCASDVETGFLMRSAIPQVLAAWGLQFIREDVQGK